MSRSGLARWVEYSSTQYSVTTTIEVVHRYNPAKGGGPARWPYGISRLNLRRGFDDAQGYFRIKEFAAGGFIKNRY